MGRPTGFVTTARRAAVVLSVSWCALAGAVRAGDGDAEGPVLVPFGTPTIATIGAGMPAHTAALDLGGDGRLDLVVVDEVNGATHVLMANADLPETFLPGPPLPGGGRLVVTGDFDADARDDVAEVDSTRSAVRIRLQLADGTLGAPFERVIAAVPTHLAIAELDGDDRPELAVATGDGVTILFHDDGFFDAREAVAAGESFDWIVATDVDGDDRADVVAASRAAAGVTVLRNGGGLDFDQTWIDVGEQARAIATADFDTNGTVDLVVAGRESLSLWDGTGDGSFGFRAQLATGTHDHVAAVDMNRDGRVDVVTGRAVLVNAGDGFVAGGPVAESNQQRRNARFTLGDLDGDRRPDLIRSSQLLGLIALRRNESALAERDCNDNGRADGLDIVDGTSADCDGNHVPDECDVETGARTDCNENGVPDACELEVLLEMVSGPAFARTYRPFDIAAADFDGDGYCDLATGSLSPFDDIAVLFSGPAGAVDRVAHASVGTELGSVAAVDLNADGEPDIVGTGLGIPTAFVLWNVGGGSFEAIHTIPLPGWPSAAIGADVDGDGRDDLAISISGSQWSPARELVVLRNTGGDEPEPLAPVTVGDYPVALAAADLDADGQYEIVTASAALGTVSIVGFDDGDLVEEAEISVLLPARSVSVADVDGDERLELVVGVGDLENAAVVVVDPELPDAPPWSTPVEGDPQDLAVVDLDGDGAPDVLAPNAAGLTVLWNRSGVWDPEPLQPTPTVLASIRRLTIHDLDGDGDVDIAATDEGAQGVWIWRNDGARRFTLRGTPIGLGSSVDLAAADFDGDGDTDGALLNRGLATVSWFANERGGEEFIRREVFDVLAPGGRPTALAAGDVDGDGSQDLAVADLVAARLVLLLSEGAGGFRRRELVAPTGLADIVLADLDGDQRAEIVAAGVDSEVIVFYWRGAGLDPVVRRAAAAGPISQVVVADLDADGRSDIVAVNQDGSVTTAQVFAGADDGELLTPRLVELGGLPAAIAAVDLDDDGWTDLVSAQRHPQTIGWLRNAGDGSFERSRHSYSRRPHALLPAELDGLPGHDLVTVGQLNEGITFVLGRVDAPRLIPAPDERVGAAVAADFDSDGLDDLLSISLAGRLTIQSNRTTSERDRDGDGVIDLCEVNPFHRGDANADGRADVSDAVFLLDFLFLGGSAPTCIESADADNGGGVDISDAVYVLGFLFLGGPLPAAPGPPPEDCGFDPDPPGSSGALGCAEYAGC